jgi:hypothetical protein
MPPWVKRNGKDKVTTHDKEKAKELTKARSAEQNQIHE